MRRLFIVMIGCAALGIATVAHALTVRDVIELSKQGVSDQVLLALIDVDHRVYTIDADAVKRMKAAGVSDTVMLAMINAGRDDPGAAAAGGQPIPASDVAQPEMPPQPQAGAVDYSDSEPAVVEVPVPVPVAVPVAVAVAPVHQERISTIITTDADAAVRVRVPVPANCVKAEPIYWGNGGKRRPGTWVPPPQIVCR